MKPIGEIINEVMVNDPGQVVHTFDETSVLTIPKLGENPSSEQYMKAFSPGLGLTSPNQTNLAQVKEYTVALPDGAPEAARAKPPYLILIALGAAGLYFYLRGKKHGTI